MHTDLSMPCFPSAPFSPLSLSVTTLSRHPVKTHQKSNFFTQIFNVNVLLRTCSCDQSLIVSLQHLFNELVSSFLEAAATNLCSSSQCSCFPCTVLTCLNVEEARLKPPSVMSEIGYRNPGHRGHTVTTGSETNGPALIFR